MEAIVKTQMSRSLAALAALMVATFLVALPQAHGELKKSEPAANAMLTTSPEHVRLWFSEQPDLAVSKIALTGPAGAIELGPVRAMAENSIMAMMTAPLPPASYTIAWQTAGDDGHVLKGEIKFMVH
jgi:methionine-rich copper-binding protein CopC